MEKVLEGSLARFEAPDLLTFLNMCRRTGVLVMERSDQETKLFLREGRPVYATSSKEDMRLGAMLVRMGKVAADALESALRRHGALGHRVGQVLIAEKILTEAELASCLKVQVSEVIFDTFRWGEGLFTFWDRVPPPATAVTLEMDLQNLLMEGARRIDERGRLAEVFPDLGMVVETVTNPERVKHSVNLTPEEWKVFFLVDGRRTLSEICHLAGNVDEAVTLQILHNLVVAKFVSVVPAPSPSPTATLPPPAAAEAEGHGTQKVADDRAASPAGPVSVEFSAGEVSPKPEDDTKEIVTPKAVQYMGARKLTASRLVLVKDGSETSYPLTRDTYTVGRHRNNDIVVSDPKVSSFHARFDRTAEGFVLVDLRSRNGSFVNGKRVDAVVLETGDEVRLGTARLRYKMD